MGGNRQTVAVRGASSIDGDIATRLDDAVEGRSVNQQIFLDGIGFRAERLDNEDITALEMPHVQLTERHFLFRTMGNAIDDSAAHPADPFPAIVIKDYGIFSFLRQFLVQHIKHLEKGHIGMNTIQCIGLELAQCITVRLPPDL
ncbi:MAG: hypothetical protein ACD_75C02583G0002 [uncultured bacterium]|nr:MAG: hypothetical protein ACD_75C02583G0002 [uncultured bacterium]